MCVPGEFHLSSIQCPGWLGGVRPWSPGVCDIGGDTSPHRARCGAAAAVRLQPAAMAGRITKILLVLAILQHTLRADAQSAQTTAEVLTQHEEQRSQMTWLARAGKITKILVVLGILQYTVRMDLPSVKDTEELLRQHEKERILEMTRQLMMEQRMQKQSGLTPGRVLLLACQEWWFWVSAEILLVLFGIYWLPRQRSSDCDDGSQWETSTSAQEQVEEEEKDWKDDPDSYDTTEKPPNKSWALWRICWRDTPVAVGSSD
ncbi:uncharacterized protein LOC109143923 [Corvus cornix cornix]|uniref:uncharacterized protein LOC109143923 n=1 Tax=Corvus cornix cornix TaxID=932674 RepID=UPI000900BE61|nr:uncharacterized protein LOC109143923 [Corvus cornix cornix]